MMNNYNSVAVGTICFASAAALAVYLGANVSVWLCALFFVLTIITFLLKLKIRCASALFLVFLFLFSGSSYFVIYDHFSESAIKNKFENTTHNTEFIITEKRENNSFNIYTCAANVKDNANNAYNVKFNIYSNTKIDADCYDKLSGDITFSPLKDNEYYNYNRSCGVFLDASLKGDRIIKKCGDTVNLNKIILLLRDKTRDALHKNMRPDRSQVLSALLTGDTYNLSGDLKNTFSDLSVYHMLVISGFHTSIIGFMLYEALSLIFGRKSKIAAVLSCLFLFMFAIFAGFSPSVIRSVIMSSFFVFSSTIRRYHSGVTSMGLAAFIMTVFNPYNALNIGFLLSFLSVFGVIVIFPKLYGLISFQFLRWKPIKLFLDYVYKSICVTFSATVSTLPITIIVFKKISPYLLISNLVMLPFVELAVVAGVITAALSLVFPGAFVTSALFSSESFIIKLLLDIANGIKALPVSTFRFNNDYEITVFFTVCVVLISPFVYLKFKQWKNNIIT
ncbi:MAG: ComEC/Rec2 family competence protein [Clostridiales bacterium]|nr:ComEC/Rec2 family competence protein [Clostridiales bacterium]